MSIHQPRIEIFQLIKRVVLLAPGGHVIYVGAAPGILTYLTTMCPDAAVPENPADMMLDVVASELRDHLVETFEQSTERRELDASIQAALDENASGLGSKELFKKQIAPVLSQLRLLSMRSLRSSVRNPLLLTLHVGIAAVCAVGIGITFYDVPQYDSSTTGVQDRLGIMFFILMYLSLLSLSSIPIWREDQEIFIHERGSGAYDTFAYFVATVCCDLVPYRILPPCVFAAISYPMVSLADGRLSDFILVLILFNLVMSGLCMLVGVMTKSNPVANAAGSLVVLFSLLFAGFLANSSIIPDSWLWMQYVSPAYYGYNALIRNELEPIDDLYITTVIGNDKQKAGPFTGNQMLKCLSLGANSVDFNITVLGIYFVVILATMFLVMHFWLRETR